MKHALYCPACGAVVVRETNGQAPTCKKPACVGAELRLYDPKLHATPESRIETPKPLVAESTEPV